MDMGLNMTQHSERGDGTEEDHRLTKVLAIHSSISFRHMNDYWAFTSLGARRSEAHSMH